MLRSARLAIARTLWSGSRPGDTSTSRRVVAVAEEDTLALDDEMGATYSIQVLSIEHGALTVVPSGRGLCPCNPDGTIRLRDRLGPTTLRVGQELTMATPTMDVGVVWKVSLLDITD